MKKNYFKFIYSCIICLLLFIPSNVQAIQNKKYVKESGIIKNTTFTSNIEKSSYEESKLYNNYIETCNSLGEVEESIINHMKNRDVNFIIKYTGGFSTLKSDLRNIFSDIKKTEDYLAFSYSSMSWSAEGYEGDIDINFNFEYLTTKEQEDYVDRRVDSILSSIITDDMNEDKKEKAIHDYIVSHVAYDTTYVNHSAYDALAKGTTVCQGYALLTYKMLSKVGIDVRIVEGYAGESHAWNLVKIRGNWYHLDCTWDDPVPDRSGRVNYDYYNLSDYQMSKDHSWTSSNYPAANTIYKYEDVNESIHKFDDYRKWEDKGDVPFNKVWTVAFKTTINQSSVNEDNVYVLDENLNKVDVYIQASDWTVVVKPKYSYAKGHIYYLVLEKNILSNKGKGMKSPIVMKFNIQNY